MSNHPETHPMQKEIVLKRRDFIKYVTHNNSNIVLRFITSFILFSAQDLIVSRLSTSGYVSYPFLESRCVASGRHKVKRNMAQPYFWTRLGKFWTASKSKTSSTATCLYEERGL